MARNARKKNQTKNKKKKNKVKSKTDGPSNDRPGSRQSGSAEEGSRLGSADLDEKVKGASKEQSTDGTLEDPNEEGSVEELSANSKDAYVDSADTAFVDLENPIYFADLPEEFSVPNVPLYTRQFVPLTQCDVCGSYSGRATLSVCKHKYCGHCVRVSRTGRTVYCFYCKKQLPANTLEACGSFLEQLVVQCRCGLEAGLARIKQHISSMGGKCKNAPLCVKHLTDLTRHKKARKWADRCGYLANEVKLRRSDVKPPEDHSTFFKKVKVQPHLPHVYLDVEADGLFLGRIFVELRADVVPNTAANFVELCTNPNGYRGSLVDFIVPHTLCQTGKLSSTKSSSNVWPTFAEECRDLKHDRPGTLSMANTGLDFNRSEFCITAVPTPWRDGHYVVFGYVVSGIHIVNRICGTTRDDGYPTRRIRLCRSGVLNEWQLPSVSHSPGPAT